MMCDLRLFRIITILTIITSVSTAANVRFFQEANFQGDVQEANSTASCQELPDGFKNLIGSINSTGCVVVFPNNDCTAWNGYVIKSAEGDLTSLPKNKDQNAFKVNSFRDCTEMEKRPQADLDYYEEFSYHNESIRNICKCASLISLGTIEHLAHSHGNCFKIYSTTNCEGEPILVENALKYRLYQDHQSIKPCVTPVTCHKLKFTMFGMNHIPDPRESPGTIKQDAISIWQTMDNKQVITIVDLYRVQKDVKETAEIEYSDAWSQLQKASNGSTMEFEDTNESSSTKELDADLSVEGSAGFVSGKVTVGANHKEGKIIKESIRNTSSGSSYAESENTSKSNTKSTFVTTKSVVFSKKIVIPPCTSYTVMSYIQMAENVQTKYRLLFEITGTKADGEKLTKQEIRQGLDSYVDVVNGHDRENDFNIITKTFATITSSFGINSIMVGRGEPLLNCVEKFKQHICTTTGKFNPTANA